MDDNSADTAPRQVQDWIAGTEVFRHAEEDVLQRLAMSSATLRLPEGATLFSKGDEALAMYVVAEGLMSVHIDGHELSELGKGSLFGEYSLVDELPRSASVVAKSDVILIELKKKEFMEVLKADNRLCLAVIKLMISRHRRMNELEERLASSFSEIQKQNSELMQLNAEKNLLIDLVAHDLRNPLTSSKCAVEMLRDNSSGLSADQTDYIRLIENALVRMKNIVNQILDTEVIEARQLKVAWQMVDFATVLKEVTEGLQSFAQQKNIAIITLAESTSVRSDKSFIAQIFDNLISNAIKYSPIGSAIVVRLSKNPTFIRFEVQDQGPGIAADELPILFNRYQRCSVKPTAGETSLGLGLSIVKKLITALNGEVFCESKPGEGSRFIAIIPA